MSNNSSRDVLQRERRRSYCFVKRFSSPFHRDAPFFPTLLVIFEETVECGSFFISRCFFFCLNIFFYSSVRSLFRARRDVKLFYESQSYKLMNIQSHFIVFSCFSYFHSIFMLRSFFSGWRRTMGENAPKKFQLLRRWVSFVRKTITKSASLARNPASTRHSLSLDLQSQERGKTSCGVRCKRSETHNTRKQVHLSLLSNDDAHIYTRGLGCSCFVVIMLFEFSFTPHFLGFAFPPKTFTTKKHFFPALLIRTSPMLLGWSAMRQREVFSVVFISFFGWRRIWWWCVDWMMTRLRCASGRAPLVYIIFSFSFRCRLEADLGWRERGSQLMEIPFDMTFYHHSQKKTWKRKKGEKARAGGISYKNA